MDWFEQFKQIVIDFVGFVLPTGEQPHLRNFIERRREKLGYKTVSDYLEVLRSLGADSEEGQKIINAVTNKKTYFYS